MKINQKFLPSTNACYFVNMSVLQVPAAVKNAIKRALQSVADFFSWAKNRVCSFFTKKQVTPNTPQAPAAPKVPAKISVDEGWKKDVEGLSPLLRYAWNEFFDDENREWMENRYRNAYYGQEATSQDLTARFHDGVICVIFHKNTEGLPKNLKKIWKAQTNSSKSQMIKTAVGGFPAEVETAQKEAINKWVQEYLCSKLELIQWNKDFKGCSASVAFIFNQLNDKEKAAIQKAYTEYASETSTSRKEHITQAITGEYFNQAIERLDDSLRNEWTELDDEEKQSFKESAIKDLVGRLTLSQTTEAIDEWLNNFIRANLEGNLVKEED